MICDQEQYAQAVTEVDREDARHPVWRGSGGFDVSIQQDASLSHLHRAHLHQVLQQPRALGLEVSSKSRRVPETDRGPRRDE